VESAGREHGKEIRKAARRGRKMATKCKKMLNRGNKLKDLLKTQDLAVFRAKNKLKTNPVLSAKMSKSKRKKGPRRQVLGARGWELGARDWGLEERG
jgi:predicted molibdopterin-dependent oxidoreductase YjgC